jgi:hypothetical protein
MGKKVPNTVDNGHVRVVPDVGFDLGMWKIRNDGVLVLCAILANVVRITWDLGSKFVSTSYHRFGGKGRDKISGNIINIESSPTMGIVEFFIYQFAGTTISILASDIVYTMKDCGEKFFVLLSRVEGQLCNQSLQPDMTQWHIYGADIAGVELSGNLALLDKIFFSGSFAAGAIPST